MGFVGNTLGFPVQQWKNFENPSRIDKVIAISLVFYFFETVYIVYHFRVIWRSIYRELEIWVTGHSRSLKRY